MAETNHKDMARFFAALAQAGEALPSPKCQEMAAAVSRLMMHFVAIERSVSPQDSLVVMEFLTNFTARALVEGEQVAKERL